MRTEKRHGRKLNFQILKGGQTIESWGEKPNAEIHNGQIGQVSSISYEKTSKHPSVWKEEEDHGKDANGGPVPSGWIFIILRGSCIEGLHLRQVESSWEVKLCRAPHRKEHE